MPVNIDLAVLNHFSNCILRASRAADRRRVSVSVNRPEEEKLELQFTTGECSDRIGTTGSIDERPRIQTWLILIFKSVLVSSRFLIISPSRCGLHMRV